MLQYSSNSHFGNILIGFMCTLDTTIDVFSTEISIISHSSEKNSCIKSSKSSMIKQHSWYRIQDSFLVVRMEVVLSETNARSRAVAPMLSIFKDVQVTRCTRGLLL